MTLLAPPPSPPQLPLWQGQEVVLLPLEHFGPKRGQNPFDFKPFPAAETRRLATIGIEGREPLKACPACSNSFPAALSTQGPPSGCGSGQWKEPHSAALPCSAFSSADGSFDLAATMSQWLVFHSRIQSLWVLSAFGHVPEADLQPIFTYVP